MMLYYDNITDKFKNNLVIGAFSWIQNKRRTGRGPLTFFSNLSSSKFFRVKIPIRCTTIFQFQLLFIRKNILYIYVITNSNNIVLELVNRVGAWNACFKFRSQAFYIQIAV